jgi:hypothetical protein
MIPSFSTNFGSRKLIYALDMPSFQRDFASLKTLDHGTGPNITFTRNSNATFFDADGVLQTAGTDVPRFDHDPAAGASRGLLIEEARTNSLRNSQAGGATNGVLGSGGGMPTNWAAGAGASSNGITTEIIGTGTESGLPYIDLKVSGTPTTNGLAPFNLETLTQVVAANGQTWTHSAYFKLVAGALTNATLRIAADGRAADGSAISGQASSTAFTVNTNEIKTQRKSHSATFSNAAVERILPSFQVAYTNGNPIDLTLRIAAPQLEQGAFATSYIPTTTAAATRAADSAVVTPISSFYNQSEGTLFAEGQTNPSNTGTTAILLGISSSTANYLALWRVNSNQFAQGTAIVSNVSQAAIGATAWSATSPARLALAYKTDDFAFSFNGGTAGTDTSGSVPSGLDRLTIGIRHDTGAVSNGHIRKIAYWPKRLTNTLLEQLTT